MSGISKFLLAKHGLDMDLPWTQHGLTRIEARFRLLNFYKMHFSLSFLIKRLTGRRMLTAKKYIWFIRFSISSAPLTN